MYIHEAGKDTNLKRWIFQGFLREIIHNPGLTGMCALVTKNDLEYWGIDELLLEPCCALRYYPEIELCVKEVEGEEISRKKARERRQAEDFGDTKLGRVRKYLWNLTEYPETSKAAQVTISSDQSFLSPKKSSLTASEPNQFDAKNKREPRFIICL